MRVLKHNLNLNNRRLLIKILFFVTLFNQNSIGQVDTCSYFNFGKYKSYQLNNLSKMNKDRLIGLSNGILNIKDTIYLSNINQIKTEYFEDQITDFIQNEKIEIKEYIVQSAFISNGSNDFLFIILQMNPNDNFCFDDYVLFQYGGGNSFCVFLFDINNHRLINQSKNTWN